MDGQEAVMKYFSSLVIFASIVIFVIIRSSRAYDGHGIADLGFCFKITILALIASIVFAILRLVAFAELFFMLTKASLILAGVSFLVGIAVRLFK